MILNHAKEKRNQNFKKESILAAVSNIQTLIKREETDEVRAIYGAGNYVLSNEYKVFKVQSHLWHTWSTDRKQYHVEKFRSYKPTLDDHFNKPASCGKKPGFQIRHRNRSSPDMIVERHVAEEPTIESTTINSLSFDDPRKKKEHVYQLYLRKNLPKSISKCQGRCGKNITQDDVLIVKTFGKTAWTDRKTGQQREKYGPMYVHFLEDCLKNFDDKGYFPGESFPITTIHIDEPTKTEMNEQDTQFLASLRIV